VAVGIVIEEGPKKEFVVYDLSDPESMIRVTGIVMSKSGTPHSVVYKRIDENISGLLNDDKSLIFLNDKLETIAERKTEVEMVDFTISYKQLSSKDVIEISLVYAGIDAKLYLDVISVSKDNIDCQSGSDTHNLFPPGDNNVLRWEIFLQFIDSDNFYAITVFENESNDDDEEDEDMESEGTGEEENENDKDNLAKLKFNWIIAKVASKKKTQTFDVRLLQSNLILASEFGDRAHSNLDQLRIFLLPAFNLQNTGPSDTLNVFCTGLGVTQFKQIIKKSVKKQNHKWESTMHRFMNDAAVR
jgi:hypothetical protein